jgi:hypothetical protein
MSTLLLRCPQKPSDSSLQEWNSDQLMFEWALADGMWQKGLIENVPFADEIIALMPSIDVRLIELKVPTVSDKKLKTILSSLLEEEILGSISQNDVQLLPQLSYQSQPFRTVAVIDANWFKWLYEQLSNLIFSKIKLIPEFFAIPLNESNREIYFTEHFNTRTYISRLDILKVVLWMQPKEASLSSLPFQPNTNHQPLLLTDQILLDGVSQLDINLKYINLLPERFYQIRKKGQKQLKNWGTKELWELPLRWAYICLCVLILSKLGYVGYLSWMNYSWQQKLTSAAQQTIGSPSKDALKVLPLTACQIDRKNGQLCSSEFLPMLNHLDGILETLPPDSLIGISYSPDGLIFELNSNVDSKLLIANPAVKNQMIQRITATQFILRPFGGLGVITK